MPEPTAAQGDAEHFTIIGSRGFIGSALVQALSDQGCRVETLGRGADPAARPLGHVIFAAGVTADFRWRPIDTMTAHVSALADVLEKATFSSLLYLSSTRVYEGSAAGREDATLAINPNDPLQLYNASKAAGEALCLALDRPEIRVARVSNVVGARDTSETLMSALLREAASGGIHLRSSPDSAKDFILLDDVIALLPRLRAGRARLYNVASGRNSSYGSVVRRLGELSGADVRFTPDAEVVTFPPVDISRIREEFGFEPTPLDEALARIWREYSELGDD